MTNNHRLELVPPFYLRGGEMLSAHDVGALLASGIGALHAGQRPDDAVDIQEASRITRRSVDAIRSLRKRFPGRFPAPIQGGGQGRAAKLYFRRQDVIDFAKKDPARAA